MAPNRKTCWWVDVIALFVILQICVTPSLSAEIRVPDDYMTITEALLIADDNDTIDTILVAPGTYSEPNESFPLRIQKAVALRCDSDDPNDRPHLKGDGKHTVVLIGSGGVTLQDFRITDGSGSEGINSMDGGGVCVFVTPGETRDVNIINCLIENNTCPSDETYDGCGGGIYCGGTYCECFTVNISNCIIRNNSIHGCGGGVFCALLSIVDMNDSYIEDNKADDHGGGVFVDFYASINMNKTHLARNNCPGDTEKENWGGKGGALACESLGIFTATDCLFAENMAKYFGGGIFTRGGLFDVNDLCGRSSEFSYVSNSLIRKNRADISGGGVYIASSGILGFSNTTLYWNDARQDGGAVFVAGGAMGGGVVNLNSGCLLEGNESAHYGGGVYLGSNALGTFEFTRFIGNSALFDGGAMFLEEDASAALTECRLVYNNSARGYAGGIRAASQSWLDIMHCSIVGNFAPRMRSGLYLDPNSVVNIRDSILWHNAGGSVDANGAIVNIGTSLSEDGADPDNGVICCDPEYVGWDGLEEIYVDSLAPYPGVGTLENPYHDLQVALDDFDFSLAEGSPCMNTASDGGNVGANTGVGGEAGNVTIPLHLANGTYDIRGRNIIFTRGVQGTSATEASIRHAVFGYVEDTFVGDLAITAEETFGGIVIRADVNFVNCHVHHNNANADGGGIYVAEGQCSVIDCEVYNNSCPIYGGGLYLGENTATTIEGNSRISSNSAGTGGGIYVLDQLQVKGTEDNIVNFSWNKAGSGGAIYISNTADVNVAYSLFYRNNRNLGGSTGGGLRCLGKAKITYCNFEQNDAKYGGAIRIDQPAMLHCQDCTFKINRARWRGNGGALYVTNDTDPCFVHCNFIENSSNHSGGVGACYGSKARFNNCSFRSNTAQDYGGCFYLSSTETHFRNCEFFGKGNTNEPDAKLTGGMGFLYDNDASLFEHCHIQESVAGTNGGAFCIKDTAQPFLYDVNIVDCSATERGGGIVILNSAEPNFCAITIRGCNAIRGGGLCAEDNTTSTFQQCAFLNNSAYILTESADGGGACFTWHSVGRFNECVFRGNHAEDDGGGIATAGWADMELLNTLFAYNTARNDGGGIHFTAEAKGILTNCTLACNNSVEGGTGAGVYLEAKNLVKINSSIIRQNSPDGIRPESDPNVGYSCVQKPWSGSGNIVTDPLFADPDNGDYHLKSQAGRWDPNSQIWLQDDVTSPCIDAGDPTSSTGLEPSPNGGKINMGAYGGTIEASKSP
jgi:predicted outer membrane repeat protein